MHHSPPNIGFQRTRAARFASALAAGAGSFAVSGYRVSLMVTSIVCVAVLAWGKDVTLKQPVTAMEPTIKKDQVFTMSTVAVGYRPETGALVVFKMPGHPDRLDLKRVEALPGDTVEVRDKNLYRNGKEIHEPYVVHRDYKLYDKAMPKDLEFYVKRDQMPPRKVQPGAVFVMGDNRDESWDSRYFGDVPLSTIVGYVKDSK